MDIKATNGVSFSIYYEITAADDSAGTVDFDFPGLDATPVGVIQIRSAAGVVVGSDEVVTFADEKITVADGTTYQLTAGDFIVGIANRLKK